MPENVDRRQRCRRPFRPKGTGEDSGKQDVQLISWRFPGEYRINKVVDWQVNFGWKLRCSYGVFACIPALITLDLAPGPAGPFSL